MWILERKSDGKKVYLLNKEYTVGRKCCTIEVSDDPSVSRKHFKLLVDYSPLVQDSGSPTLQIMDLGSTYGVFINPSTNNPGKINPNMWTSLQANTSFHFGIKNEWTVKWKDINVICSAVSSQARKKLNQELVKLGAKVILAWQNGITHLVTDKIMLTQKVLDSLLEVIPIVEASYFESWTELLEKNPCSPIPDLSKAVPSIGQDTLAQFDRETFLPKEDRRTLFAGKTFLFADSKVLQSIMAIAVEKAGGKVSTKIEDFRFGNSILIETSLPSPPEGYVELLKTLSSRQERPVPEKEIGLAILACSIDRFCNPRFFSGNEQKDEIEQSQSQSQTKPLNVEPAAKRIKTSMDLNETTLKQPNEKRIRTEDGEHDQPPMKKINLDRKAMSDFQRPESDVKVSVISKPLENVQKQQVKVEDIPASLPIVRPTMYSTSTPRMNRTMDGDKSKWMHQRSSPVKKTDKLMVRTSLVRSESVGSQKISSTFKEGAIISRIRTMKIACYKDGRWSTNN